MPYAEMTRAQSSFERICFHRSATRSGSDFPENFSSQIFNYCSIVETFTRKVMRTAKFILAFGVCCLLLGGCNKNSTTKNHNSTPAKPGFIG
jgi:hypothetical protein